MWIVCVTILIIKLTTYLLLDKYRAGWIHPKRFMFHGVVREKGRGVPVCLYQKKETTQLVVAHAMWTLKVYMLNRDTVIPNFVAISSYDSKPFYYMSDTYEVANWNQTTRQVWHRYLQKVVEIPLFSLNLIRDYNHGINDVDLPDHVRNVY